MVREDLEQIYRWFLERSKPQRFAITAAITVISGISIVRELSQFAGFICEAWRVALHKLWNLLPFFDFSEKQAALLTFIACTVPVLYRVIRSPASEEHEFDGDGAWYVNAWENVRVFSRCAVAFLGCAYLFNLINADALDVVMDFGYAMTARADSPSYEPISWSSYHWSDILLGVPSAFLLILVAMFPMVSDGWQVIRDYFSSIYIAIGILFGLAMLEPALEWALKSVTTSLTEV